MKQQRTNSLAIGVMEQTGHFLATGSGAVSALLFAAMAFVTFLGVFFRYVVRDPLHWTEELARFLMLWAGFLAMNVAMHHRQHINIDIIVRALPTWLSKSLGYICDLLICYFLIVLTMKGYSMSFNTMVSASSMKFSMFWIYMAVPVGAFFTLVQVLLISGAKVLHDFTSSSDTQPTSTEEGG